MDILDVNEYLNAASDALQDDPEYFHWIQALGNARKQALDECDCYTGKVEGCLWQVYVRQVKYILENIGKIDKAIAEAEKEFSETGEYVDAKEAFDDLRDEYDIDTLNPRPNPYAAELKASVPKAVDEMSKPEYDAMMAKGLAQAKADEGKPASDVLKNVRATIEDALDEADDYSEKHYERLTHAEIFNSETKVTFRQVVEKTITVDGRNMSDIQAQIEKLKENPDEIDFDKDCDSVVIEARVNL